MTPRGKPFEKGHVPHNKVDPIFKACERCGSIFSVPPCRKDKARFCSRLCQNRTISEQYDYSGSSNPNWKGGISVAYYRRIFFYNLPKICNRCGIDKNLVVHHKDENRQNNTITNLEVVCRKCHQTIHGVLNSRDELGRFI